MGDIHEQDVRGGGVLSVQEHLLSGAMGWASVPYCPCLGLPPPGSLHGLCLLCRDATQCHSACGHTALQKVAAATQLYSGQCVPGGGSSSSASSLSSPSSSPAARDTSSLAAMPVLWRPSWALQQVLQKGSGREAKDTVLGLQPGTRLLG